MNKEETPISKYLASLERRQALVTPSPPPDPNAIIRKINFEDDTFFQGDQSVMLISPSPGGGGNYSRGGVAKRKRLSILGESLEEGENQNKKMNDLERLLQQTQGELIDARATNTKLEYQIGQIRRANEERILGFQSAQNEMKTRMREAIDQAEHYKEQLNKVTRKEEELRETLHEQSEKHSERMNTLEKKVRALETENFELKGKFDSGTLRQSDELRKLSTSLEETEMGAEKWVMETQMLRDQIELKDKQLQKYQNELKEAQVIICKYNEIKAKYDDSKSSEGSSTDNLEEKIKYFENLYVKQQTENIRLAQRMEKIADENRMLRSSMNREMLLEEQISTFEEEVNALRSNLDKKAEVEAENGTLRSEISAWKTMAFKLDPDCTSYMKFESYIRKIQNQLLEAKHEVSTNKLDIAEKDRNLSKAQAQILLLQEQVKSLSTERDNISQELKKTSRRLLLVTKDRDGLKELKESYEQEFEGVISKPLQERINQLEATVAEYEAMIQEDPSSKKSCGECEKRIALISEIRTEMDRLKREKADVEAQIANISTMGTGGAEGGDTTDIKIVSFGLNPSAMSLDARLKEAIKENEELKEKLQELQDQTIAGSSKQISGNLGELEDKNKTLERKLQILTEAYDFETQQLQIIVNKLFGFHFTLVREPSVQIRLSSVYATGQDDTFIFQESPNGDMLLLESPVLDNFRNDINRYLLQDGSIPAFLASVTITYVQNQSTQNTSQLPASQQSAVEDDDEESNASVSMRDPREIQVEVQRQRHPTSDDDDEDDEDDHNEDDEDDEDDRNEDDEDDDGEHDDGEDGLEPDEEDYADEEPYEEDPEDEYGDESEEEPVQDSPSPPRRSRPPPPSRPPAGNESDDSDVIMIDSD